MVKGIRNRVFVLLAAIWILMGVASCEKPDNLPQLEIHVLDLAGRPVSSAYAALFITYDEWIMQDNPVQAWRKTGIDGKVLFTDLQEISYYIYIRSGDADNTLNEIRTTGSLSANQRRILTVHIQ